MFCPENCGRNCLLIQMKKYGYGRLKCYNKVVTGVANKI